MLRFGKMTDLRGGKKARFCALSADMDLSLVVPCYNEEENVDAFLKAATACLDAKKISYELVFVDDGSSDGTLDVLKAAIERYQRASISEAASCKASIEVIELSRNFGKESALYAGLENATGECIGFIDADLQQDPQVAFNMYQLLQENPNVDSVAAAPAKRKEPLPLRASKQLFYRVFNGLSDTKLLANVSDFRVFRRQVADTLLAMPEQYRFSKGLFSWVGFKTEVIEYEVKDRHSGKSRWSFRGLVSYAWNGVLAFSSCPLSLISGLGAVLMVLSLVFLAGIACAAGIFHQGVSISLIVLGIVGCLAGIQLLALGVVGEYASRSYIEGKRRPVYIARRKLQYPAQKSSAPLFRVVGGRAKGAMPANEGVPSAPSQMRLGCLHPTGEQADSAKMRVVIGGKAMGKRL